MILDFVIQRSRSKSNMCQQSRNLIVRNAVGLHEFPNVVGNTAMNVMPNNPVNIVRIKEENQLLRDANNRLNARLGDEIISDDVSISSLEDFETEVNTRHYQYDHQFSGKYGFITNVRLYWKCVLDKHYYSNYFLSSVSRRSSLFRRQIEDKGGSGTFIKENERQLPAESRGLWWKVPFWRYACYLHESRYKDILGEQVIQKYLWIKVPAL